MGLRIIKIVKAAAHIHTCETSGDSHSESYALMHSVLNFEIVSKSVLESFLSQEVVLRAVQMSGLALEFASSRLRAQRQVVLAAVGQDGCAIQWHGMKRLRERMERYHHISRDIQTYMSYSHTHIYLYI